MAQSNFSEWVSHFSRSDWVVPGRCKEQPAVLPGSGNVMEGGPPCFMDGSSNHRLFSRENKSGARNSNVSFFSTSSRAPTLHEVTLGTCSEASHVAGHDSTTSLVELQLERFLARVIGICTLGWHVVLVQGEQQDEYHRRWRRIGRGKRKLKEEEVPKLDAY